MALDPTITAKLVEAQQAKMAFSTLFSDVNSDEIDVNPIGITFLKKSIKLDKVTKNVKNGIERALTAQIEKLETELMSGAPKA